VIIVILAIVMSVASLQTNSLFSSSASESVLMPARNLPNITATATSLLTVSGRVNARTKLQIVLSKVLTEFITRILIVFCLSWASCAHTSSSQRLLRHFMFSSPPAAEHGKDSSQIWPERRHRDCS
jgi:hypothetical protein